MINVKIKVFSILSVLNKMSDSDIDLDFSLPGLDDILGPVQPKVQNKPQI